MPHPSAIGRLTSRVPILGTSVGPSAGKTRMATPFGVAIRLEDCAFRPDAISLRSMQPAAYQEYRHSPGSIETRG